MDATRVMESVPEPYTSSLHPMLIWCNLTKRQLGLVSLKDNQASQFHQAVCSQVVCLSTNRLVLGSLSVPQGLNEMKTSESLKVGEVMCVAGTTDQSLLHSTR